jgi:F0F1-type ATP synthase assembly protein I
MAAAHAQLLHYARLARSPMSNADPRLGYLILFSEIGFTLLVTTLLGVLAGYWLDGQIGTLPVFLIIGFLAGAGAGTVMIARMINRFLKQFD